MGDFRKKVSHRLISNETNFCKEIPGGKNFCTEKNILSGVQFWKKIRTSVNVGEKKLLSPEVEKKNSCPNQITHKSALINVFSVFFGRIAL